MALIEYLTHGHRSEYIDRLAPGAPARTEFVSARRILAALFALCLVPRLLVAWKLGAVCDDAYFYIYTATALKQGDLTTALESLNLNVYPFVLLAIEKLGLDWVVAGKLWGVFISSALVLPLFGWVRRLFDDRVAALACFLYAVHPQLIEISVEPIRDATFWFLFTQCLYLLWRSTTELRMGFFVLAGVVLALALHTRVESLAIFVPLLLWCAFRWRCADGAKARRHLIAGACACLSVTPLLLVLVNFTLLRDHHQWEFGRLSHFAVVGNWLRSGDFPEAKTAAQPTGGTSAPDQTTDLNAPHPADGTVSNSAPRSHDTGLGFVHRALLCLKNLWRAFGPASFLLTVVGLWNWRRLALHRDKAPLLLAGLGILLAIWIRLAEEGSNDSRFFLVLLLVLAPFQALAALDVAERVSRWAAASRRLRASPEVSVVGLFVLLAVAGWVDALISHHKERNAHAALGRFLNEHVQPIGPVVADLGGSRTGHYVHGTLPIIIKPDELLRPEFERHPPGLVLFSRYYLPLEQQPRIVQRAARLGLHLVDGRGLPHTDTEFIVLVRDVPPSRTAEVSSAAADSTTTLR